MWPATLALLLISQAQPTTPTWNVGRSFTNGRVFVLPPQSLQLQYGLDYLALLDGSSTVDFLSQYAVQLGLPGRVELDFDFFVEQNDYLAPLQVQAEDLRLRWAWADWGDLWGNPTVSARFSRMHSLPPQVAVGIELGDSPWDTYRWAASLSWQRELLGISQEQVYRLNVGVLFDTGEPTLSVGAEAVVQLQDHAGDRFQFDTMIFRAAPTLQWAPLTPLSLLLAVYGGWQQELDDGSSSSSWFLQPHLFVTWAWQ